MINSNPIRDILDNYMQKYINKNINTQVINLLQNINQYLPNKFNFSELGKLSIKKSYLTNPLLRSSPYIKSLTNADSTNSNINLNGYKLYINGVEFTK